MRIQTTYFDENEQKIGLGDRFKLTLYDWAKEDYDGTEFIGSGQSFESEQFMFIAENDNWCMTVKTEDILEIIKLQNK